MENEKDVPQWAAPVGAVFLVLLLISLSLVAAGGWTWFSQFIVSSAPAWLQAGGALMALWVAVYIPIRDKAVQKKEALHAAAAFAAAMLATVRGVRRGLETPSYRGAIGVKHHLKTAADLGASLRLELLPLRLLPYVMGLRSIGDEVAECLNDLQHKEANYAELVLYIEDLVKVVEGQRAKIMAF